MFKIAVLVSGGGTNLQAIIDNINSGYLKNIKVSVVISSNENAYALQRAKDNGIETRVITKKAHPTVEEYDYALVSTLKEFDVDLVVLAGFLVIFGKYFTDMYSNKIINVHPSLIPSFCGVGYYGLVPHEKAIEYGVKITGATVHFVEYETDAGAVILQKAIDVLDDDTPESLQNRVMKEVEWNILPEAIKLFSEGSISLKGRKVIIRRIKGG
jgi:phosphoribosylglycinamide formyltransferase-1